MTTQNPTPLQQTYHGVTFRSRLEARWAFFFDKMAIKWRYEPEGYQLPSGRYLPDFVLPQCGTHVEVRGDHMRADVADLLRKGAELPQLRLAEGGREYGPSLLLLGPIPFTLPSKGDLGWLGFDARVSLETGETTPDVSRWGFTTWEKNFRPWAYGTVGDLSKPLEPSVELDYLRPPESCMRAYAAARSERFGNPGNWG